MPEKKQENLLKKRLLDRINQVSEEDLDQEVDFTEDLELGEELTDFYDAQVVKDNQEEIVKLKQENEALKAQLAESADASKALEELKQENFRLSQQVTQANIKVETTQETLNDLAAKNRGLEDENHRLKQIELNNSSNQEVEELLEKNRSLSDLLAVKEQRVAELEDLAAKNESNVQELVAQAEKAAEIQSRVQELQAALQERENHITQLESMLQDQQSSGNLSSENQEVLESLKMETAKEKEELLAQLSELKEQITSLQSENEALKAQGTTVGNATSEGERLEKLKTELQSALKEKTDLEISMGRLQGLSDKYAIQKDVLESELADLRDANQTKENELEKVNEELKVLRSAKDGNVDNSQMVELLQAKQQVNDLLLKNQSLQEEAMKSQQEIGEVMVSAKKEANRIINDAQVEAKHIINSAELEMLNIGNRAKNISNEVETSKNEVLGIYRELEERLNKLSRLDKMDKK